MFVYKLLNIHQLNGLKCDNVTESEMTSLPICSENELRSGQNSDGLADSWNSSAAATTENSVDDDDVLPAGCGEEVQQHVQDLRSRRRDDRQTVAASIS